MAVDNYYIADQFSLLSKLMDIHGENSFKTKTYSIAAFTIEKLPKQLADMPQNEIFSIKGIGDATGKKIMAILQTGELPQLKEIIEKTPPGVIEMLNIKGLGPKKIATVWKEMEIESIGELLYACNENRLLLFKGFGEKTQKNVKDTIEFYLKNQGSYLYEEAEAYTLAIDKKIKEKFNKEKFEITGEFRRQMEIINHLEWISTTDINTLKSFFEENNFSTEIKNGSSLYCKGEEGVQLIFHCCDEESFYTKLFVTSCSEEFLSAWKLKTDFTESIHYKSEEEIFSSNKLSFIP